MSVHQHLAHASQAGFRAVALRHLGRSCGCRALQGRVARRAARAADLGRRRAAPTKRLDPIARAWVDARIGRILGGSNEIMKEIIARSVTAGARPATQPQETR